MTSAMFMERTHALYEGLGFDVTITPATAA